MQTKQAYSTKEVCARYSVHPNTVRMMVKDGRLKGTKLKSHFRFSKEECDRVFLGIEPDKSE